MRVRTEYRRGRLLTITGLISQDGYEKVVEAFVKESREVAAAHLGDSASILATFQENPVPGGAPAQISKPPDVSKAPLQRNA